MTLHSQTDHLVMSFRFLAFRQQKPQYCFYGSLIDNSKVSSFINGLPLKAGTKAKYLKTLMDALKWERTQTSSRQTQRHASMKISLELMEDLMKELNKQNAKKRALQTDHLSIESLAKSGKFPTKKQVCFFFFIQK